MDKKQDIYIEIASDPKLLKSIRGLVGGYLENQGVSPDRADDVVLAVDEACANAIRHSYGNRIDGKLTLSFHANDRELEIVLNDEGIPAPANRVRRKEAVLPDKEHLTPGGLGVQLMYQVFDEVVFSPGAVRGNRVTMRLKRAAGNANLPIGRVAGRQG